jgi:hypothetical protein
MRGWWLLLIYMIQLIPIFPFNFKLISSLNVGYILEIAVLLCLPSIEPNKFDRKEKRLERMDKLLGDVQ